MTASEASGTTPNVRAAAPRAPVDKDKAMGVFMRSTIAVRRSARPGQMTGIGVRSSWASWVRDETPSLVNTLRR